MTVVFKCHMRSKPVVNDKIQSPMVSDAEMLTILVKTIANTNTNTFVAVLFTVDYIQQHSVFHGHLLIKVNRIKIVEKWQNQ